MTDLPTRLREEVARSDELPGTMFASTREALLEAADALSREQEQAVAWPSSMKVADVGFRWDFEAQHHVPTILLSFAPVPAGEPNDAKGWADRDAMERMLAAPPSPEPQPKTEKETESLSMMIRMLASSLKRRDPENTLPARAMDLLKRFGLRGSVLRAEAATAQDIPAAAASTNDLVLSLRPSEWQSLSPSARAHLRAIVHSGISEMARSQAERAEAVRHVPLTDKPEDTDVPGLQRVPLTEAGRQALTCDGLGQIPAEPQPKMERYGEVPVCKWPHCQVLARDCKCRSEAILKDREKAQAEQDGVRAGAARGGVRWRKVPFLLGGRRYEVHCPNAPSLTTTGLQIKMAAGIPSNYQLLLLMPGTTSDANITDGEAVILAADGSTEFDAIPPCTY